MRTEKEILDLVIRFAQDNEKIRAVLIEGSRANPNAPKDKYMDYDINFFVKETKPFIENQSWLSAFGTPLIVQEPELIDNITGWFGEEMHDFDRWYSWLVLFDDGVRIDFSFNPINIKEHMEKNGEPVIVLLDKDNILPKYPEPSDCVYHVKKPSNEQFHACCNEFWWCLNNVAKGIARDELPYAMNMYNTIVRNMLHKMLEWHIGIEHDFSVSAGKDGKYFKRLLPRDVYEKYAATYSDSDYESFWTAVFTACGLFHEVAVKVAGFLEVEYNQAEENGMMKYMSKCREVY
jgi:aminoglycoside 6-adenylyltransferase